MMVFALWLTDTIASPLSTEHLRTNDQSRRYKDLCIWTLQSLTEYVNITDLLYAMILSIGKYAVYV